MRYQLIGKSLSVTGKTLWEITGNLKNFGVGRLVVEHNHLKQKEPSFYKILKVVPYPSPENEYELRKAVVFVEVVDRGVLLPEQKKIEEQSVIPQYYLIPKLEEKFYWEKVRPYDPAKRKPVPKYVPWPPLFKELWEAKQKKLKVNKNISIPHLKTVLLDENSTEFMIDNEKEAWNPSIKSDLYKWDTPVEDMIKEIVRLQKMYNSLSIEKSEAE